MAKISRSGIGNKSMAGSLNAKSKTTDNNSVEKSPQNTSININHSAFTDALNEVEINFEKEELSKDLDYIKELGKKLCKNPSIELLEKYKKRVKVFLNEALKRIYKVDSKEGLKKPGHEQKIYLYVKEIDENLKQLTSDFIKEQQEALGIIEIVEGLQGLLYNIIA